VGKDTQLWIMVHIETSGQVVGTHSMIELGAIAGSLKHGVISRFNAILKPIGSAVAANRELFAKAQKEGRPPDEATKAFADWCEPFQRHLAIFVTRPAAFVWPWILWYSRTYLNKNPFGFRVVCAMSWNLAKGKKFDLQLSHVAALDAELQLKNFLKEV
jgi:hypothetical protein